MSLFIIIVVGFSEVLRPPSQLEKTQPESDNEVRVMDSPLSNCSSPLEIVIFSSSPTEYPI